MDKAYQSIDVNKQLHPTGTINTTFHKLAGKANMYVQFGYGPQTVCNQTQRQVSGSMNIDTINAKNRSTINDAKMKTKTPKKNTSKYNFSRKPTNRSNI